MANFDLTALALQAVCPNNTMITDDVEMPSFYVEFASKNLSELLTDGDSTVHPAFRVNSVEQDKLYVGKYQGYADNNRIYSLPNVDPKVSITLDTYVQYCRNKGKGHHCITAAEWAFIALLCKKNGYMPKGNNNYGKDTTETAYVALPTSTDSGKTGRVATGSGPLTWRHNGEVDGICDLNGNIWEWILGIRLVYGELQVIPYNNAADPDIDVSSTSAQWKAVNAAATSWEDLFIEPDGSGTTTNSVKLDYVSSHWQWQAATITSQSDSSRYATFGTTTSSGLSDTAKLYLQAMALLPEDDSTADDYGGDGFWANNGAAERCAFRGGGWSYGTSTGVFDVNFGIARSGSNWRIGGRPAYEALETE